MKIWTLLGVVVFLPALRYLSENLPAFNENLPAVNENLPAGHHDPSDVWGVHFQTFHEHLPMKQFL